MPTLKMSIPHTLTQQEALTRIKNLLGKLKTEYKDQVSNVSENWEDDTGNFSFSARGFDISGEMNVQPSAIDITAEIPFAVSLFKGQIKQLIENEASKLLS